MVTLRSFQTKELLLPLFSVPLPINHPLPLKLGTHFLSHSQLWPKFEIFNFCEQYFWFMVWEIGHFEVVLECCWFVHIWSICMLYQSFKLTSQSRRPGPLSTNARCQGVWSPGRVYERVSIRRGLPLKWISVYWGISLYSCARGYLSLSKKKIWDVTLKR